MICHPTGSPEIILNFEKRKNARNQWEYNILGENRAVKWLSDKQFKRHFKI